MALLNYATKEITIKIVYYGPGLSGKTTNLQHLHSVFEPAKRGKLLSLATEADRTLFFDFLPLQLGKISDFSIRFQLYTVPGQVRYNATRKLVLKGADAIVFVADSQREVREQNIESLQNMRDNLIANNINPDDLPMLLQYNKRDLVNILSTDELDTDLNKNGKYEHSEAIAINGDGVEETLHRITKLAIKGISEKHKVKVQPVDEIVEAVVEEKHEGEKVEGKTLPGMEIEQTRYEMRDTKSEEAQVSIAEEPYRQEKTLAHGIEKIAKTPTIMKKEDFFDNKEIPPVPGTKLVEMVNTLGEISAALDQLKSSISALQSDIGDIRKWQKESGSRLREITNALDNIKTKKKWFSFS